MNEHVDKHVDSCSQVVRGEGLKAIYNGTTPHPSLPDVALVFISHGEVVKLLNKAGKMDRALRV